MKGRERPGEGEGAAERRPLVLVVDDDPDLRALAAMQLGETFDVVEAGTGEECISLAAGTQPDVILLDMMLPGMSGSEVLAELANSSATSGIPVIFLSALSAPDDRARGLEQGAFDFISKPAHPSEVIARVGNAARRTTRLEPSPRVREDSLTGLPDRKAFETRVAQETARSQRRGTPFAILLLDVDQMESVNQAHGRVAGDLFLKRIAACLSETLRTSDVLFRYGGDEFAALLPDANSSAAHLASERCRSAIARSYGTLSDFTVSIGVAEMTSNRTHEELIAKAEIALFRAKESGGDRSWRADDPRRNATSPLALSEELTEREWSVLRLLNDGTSEIDIASHMNIRPGTVRSHKARIRRKLQVAPDAKLSDFVRTNLADAVSHVVVIPPDKKLEGV